MFAWLAANLINIVLILVIAAALIIGVVTYVICRLGIVLGVRIGTKINRSASIVGGCILIGIGLEILIKSFME